MQPLVLVGAGGHGRETLDVVEAINAVRPTFAFLGFVADHVDDDLLRRRDAPWLGPSDDLTSILRANHAGYHLAIGSSATRAALDADLDAAGLADHALSLVHPLASCASELRLAPGLFMAAGARLTTNITVGRHTHLNVNTAVSHDCVIGNFVTLSPGVLVNGNVTIGDEVFLGTGAIVVPGHRIGRGAVIGAGAVVTGDVPAEVTAVGVPARWT